MTGNFWQRLTRGVKVGLQREDWPRFAGEEWLEVIMDVPVTDRFHAKQGRSTGRWILQRNDESLAVYLKRHYRLSRWRGWLATLWPRRSWSPALQEWQHLQWAREQGFPVPSNVAAGEIVGPWGQLQSVLAVEELTGMLPLHEAIPLASENLEPRVFRNWKRGLITEIARLACDLHGRRYFHKDLYLCHFYIPEELCSPRKFGNSSNYDFRKRVYLIDLHRLGRHRLTWPIWQVKDLAQLAYSSEIEGVETRDRMQFWREYLATSRMSLLGGWLRKAIQLKWKRYRNHNAKRRMLATSALKHAA
jgi:hypothetical protein